MTAATEKHLWKKVKSVLVPHCEILCRMETGATVRGVPDVYALFKDGLVCWIELKVCRPTRSGFVAPRSPLTQAQAIFMAAHNGLGVPRSALVMLEPSSDKLYVIRSADALYTISIEGKIPSYRILPPVPLEELPVALGASILTIH